MQLVLADSNITINTPLNNSNQNVNYTLINITVYDSDLNNMTVYLYGDDVLINTTYNQIDGTTIEFNWTSLSEGIHNWTAIVDNGTTNVTSGYYYFTVDTIAPTITDNSGLSGGYYNTTKIINITITDANNFNATLYVNGSSVNISTGTNNTTIIYTLTEGNYSYYVTATDSVNNTNTTTNITDIIIDTTTPIITITSHTHYTNQTTINITGTYIETNLQNITINNISATAVAGNYNATITLTPNINNTITVIILDKAGLQNITTDWIISDNMPPSITIILPQNITYNNTNRTLNYTATDTNLDKVWYNYNGTNNTLSGDTTFIAIEGISTLTLYANDTAGNLNYTNLTFTIDTTPPNITYINPNQTITNINNLTFNITIYDVHLANTTFNLYNSTGGINATVYSISNNTFTQIIGLEDGIYYYNTTSFDNVGNFNITNTLNITIDTVAPNITFNYPTSSAITINISDITINITANDTHFVNSTIYLYYSNYSLMFNQTKNISENAITVSNLSDGTYYYNVTAYDSAGNRNSTVPRSIVIDTSTPVVTPPSTGGNSGSGSGGGGSSEGIYINTSSEENKTEVLPFTKYWPNIINGSRTVNIDETGMPIIQLILTTNNYTNIPNMLKITAQPNNSNKENISALIYTYIVLDTNIEQKYVDNLNLRFKVNKNWLTKNNLTTSNITLYVYDINWTGVSFPKYAEDAKYVYYSANSSRLSNMAIGGSAIPVAVLIKENINASINISNNSTVLETVNVESNATQKSFLKRVWSSIAGATNKIYNKITSIQLSPESKSLVVVAISSILTLILGVVTGVLVYRNAIKPKRLRRTYNQKIISGGIMPYTIEPSITQTTILSQPPQPVIIKTEEMPAAIPTSRDSEFYVRKISELIMQCEYALSNGKIEDAKNYYGEARALYFHSDMDYEHKSRVYNKIIELHGRLNK